nr:MAG TPA: hypothetical protein [Caudoviricetes sp.]
MLMLERMKLEYSNGLNNDLEISFTDESVRFVIDEKSVTIDSAEFQDMLSLATLFYGLNH